MKHHLSILDSLSTAVIGTTLQLTSRGHKLLNVLKMRSSENIIEFHFCTSYIPKKRRITVDIFLLKNGAI